MKFVYRNRLKSMEHLREIITTAIIKLEKDVAEHVGHFCKVPRIGLEGILDVVLRHAEDACGIFYGI